MKIHQRVLLCFILFALPGLHSQTFGQGRNGWGLTGTWNLDASRSRIEDADFAAETANLTKAQILQQAGVAVLAQANAAPQAVLGLLQ